ncbi:MAG: hypothetical protein RR553_08245, partial [Akkermansia sp.]
MIGATMDLFSLNDADEEAARGVPHEELARMPLAARMRPRQLDDVAGQEHLLGEGKLLRRAIET